MADFSKNGIFLQSTLVISLTLHKPTYDKDRQLLLRPINSLEILTIMDPKQKGQDEQVKGSGPENLHLI